MFVSQA